MELEPGKVILWYGLPVKLLKFICVLGNNSYWDVLCLYTPTPETRTIAIRREL
jgi:hypothetical protein